MIRRVLHALTWVLAAFLVMLAVGAFVRLLNPLPPLEPRSHSTAFRQVELTALGRAAVRAAASHPGRSGLHMLSDGPEAFAARVLLARAAERSLDVQYYIWHDDLSGTLMLQAMREAADRGVRVRMLLDDNGIAGMDQLLAALDLHPNVEIRLFNPFVVRSPKFVGYLTDFHRLNRRMHNKSFTVDGAATIIGGRNIGDEYFGAADGSLFSDLDVLAIGPVAGEVSSDFDRYWHSGSSYPVDRILPQVPEGTLRSLQASAAAVERAPSAQDYLQAVRSLPIVEQMLGGTLPLEWAEVRMLSDDPAKGLGNAPPEGTLLVKLREILGKPREQVGLVSGYFVPTAAGVDAFTRLAAEDVSISILTNAYEATDVAVVHAGYAGRRKALLKAGIQLFEMKGAMREGAERGRKSIIGGSGSASGSGAVARSTASTLHAKTFTVDRKRLFVGSFNFDPRSFHLNTELGFVIESPAFASAVQDAFIEQVPQSAYQVTLGSDGRLNWTEAGEQVRISHTVEPGTTFWSRLGIRLLSHLPIEWLL